MRGFKKLLKVLEENPNMIVSNIGSGKYRIEEITAGELRVHLYYLLYDICCELGLEKEREDIKELFK